MHAVHCTVRIGAVYKQAKSGVPPAQLCMQWAQIHSVLHQLVHFAYTHTLRSTSYAINSDSVVGRRVTGQQRVSGKATT